MRAILGRAGMAAAFLTIASGAGGPPEDVAIDVPTRVEVGIFHSPVRLKADDGFINSGDAWGHSGPWVEDVDGDGLRDLVVGDFSGLFRVYRNHGTNREPKYAAGVNLRAGGEDAKVPIS